MGKKHLTKSNTKIRYHQNIIGPNKWHVTMVLNNRLLSLGMYRTRKIAGEVYNAVEKNKDRVNAYLKLEEQKNGRKTKL